MQIYWICVEYEIWFLFIHSFHDVLCPKMIKYTKHQPKCHFAWTKSTCWYQNQRKHALNKSKSNEENKLKYTCILALIRFLTPTEYFRRWKVLHWSEFSGKSWLEWLRGSRMWSASSLSSHWLSSCGWRRWTLKWKLVSVWLINKSIIGNLRDWEVVEADLYWEDVQ